MHGDPNGSEGFGGQKDVDAPLEQLGQFKKNPVFERNGCGVLTFFQTIALCQCVFLAVAQLFFVVPSDFVAFGGKNEGPVTPAPAALAGQLEPGQLGAELATNFERWN